MTPETLADLAAAAGIFFAGTAFGFVLGYRETRLVHSLIEARIFDDATDWAALHHPPQAPLRGECAPECVEAEPARRGSTPFDPETPAGPFPTAGRKVAQPNYQALGLGSAEEAEGRN